MLELTKEAFDNCCKFNYPDVYKCIQDMARSEVEAPGSFLGPMFFANIKMYHIHGLK